MRLLAISVTACALFVVWTTDAWAGRPKACSMLASGQQAKCKAKVARECSHHRKYWPKVHCEDKIVRSMDVCRNPDVAQTCQELHQASGVCDQAQSMMGSSGVDPNWLKAVARFPGVYKKLQAFKPKFDSCGGRIPGCRMSSHAMRSCARAAGIFRTKWASYYRTFKSRHLKPRWDHIKGSKPATFEIQRLKKVADMNRSPLIRVNDDSLDRAIGKLTALRKKLKAEELRREARAWRRVKGTRFKKIHKKGRWANCIFSDKPLGKRERSTDKPLTRFEAGTRIYARCYFRSRPRKIDLSRFTVTLYSPLGSPGDPLKFKRYPRAYVFEVTAGGQIAHGLRYMPPGEHDVSLVISGATTEIISRQRVRNYDANGGVFYTWRTVKGGARISKGAFKYVVPQGEARPTFGDSTRKDGLRDKMRHKRRRR